MPLSIRLAEDSYFGSTPPGSLGAPWLGKLILLVKVATKPCLDTDRRLAAGRRQDSRPGGRRYLDWTA